MAHVNRDEEEQERLREIARELRELLGGIGVGGGC